MDFLYPLPLPNLKLRFGPIFSKLNTGQSVTLFSPPYTGKSSLVKFLLSQPELLSQFTSHKPIYLSPEATGKFTPTNVYKLILSQLAVETPIYLEDEFSLLHLCQKKLNELTSSDTKLIFICDYFELWHQLSPSCSHSLKSLWEIGKKFTPHRVSFFFLSSQRPSTTPFSKPLADMTLENFQQFSLFDTQELMYSLNRFLSLQNAKLPTTIKNTIIFQSSGVAGLLKPLLNIYLSQKNQTTDQLLTNPLLRSICLHLLPFHTEFSEDSFISILLSKVVPSQQVGNIALPGNLSSQDLQLIQFFIAHPNQLVSRDEVSQIIWGKLWQDKYSDWAIDKAISRLRTKLAHSPQIHLTTIKNSGYKLIVL